MREKTVVDIRVFQINDDWEDVSWGKVEWFAASIEAFSDQAPSLSPSDYDYVQVIPLANYRQFFFGNDGSQGFRHKATGWTFPDHCRQRGGCPEIWHRTKRHNLNITENSPIWSYILEY